MRLDNLLLKTKYFFHLYKMKYLECSPYHCHFQVTRRCNFKCVSCCIWKIPQRVQELTLDQIQEAAINLRKIGIKSISLTGGEPLIREDISEIIEIFKKQAFLVRFQTNGFLLKKEILGKIMSAGVDDIYISLDSLKADKFLDINGITQPEIFNIVLNNIINCAHVIRKSGVGLFLTVVLRPFNIDEIDALHNFAKEMKCLIGFYGLEVSSEASMLNFRVNDLSLIPNQDECEILKKAFIKIKQSKRIKGSKIFMSDKLLDDYIAYYANNAYNMKWNCHAGEYYLEFLCDGSIGICSGAPIIEGYNYKNITELYRLPDKKQVFYDYRKKCGGCICTKQLEYLVSDFSDLINKAIKYIKTVG